MQSSKTFRIFESLSKNLIIVSAFILPFLFFPISIPFNVANAKGFVFYILTFLAFIFWLLARIIDARFSFPKTPIIRALAFVIISFVISAFISPVFPKSFWGNGFEFGTAISVIALGIFGFLSMIYLQNIESVKKLYKLTLWSFFISTIISFSSFFFAKTKIGSFLSILNNQSTVGSWNDLAIFAGGVGMIILLALHIKNISGFRKLFLFLSLIFVLLVLALINLTSIWVILGVFALLVFVYILTISPTSEGQERKIPGTPFFVIMICLVFLLGNNLVSGFIVNKTGFNNIDIKPSISSTATVFGHTVKSGPVRAIFGVGPNRFDIAWSLYHPIGVNTTDFWNAQFSTGYGFLPTVFVTSGILGMLAIIFFFIVFVLTGVRLVFRNLREKDFNFWVTSSFFGALYLWVCAFIYPVSLVIVILAFLFTALFVATLRSSYLIGEKSINYLDDPRKSFFSISFIVVLLITSLSGIYLISERSISVYYFGKSVLASDQAKAENYALRSVSLYKRNDALLRALSLLYLNRFQTLISGQNVDKQQVQQVYDYARTFAETSINTGDSTSAINWRALGDVYAIGLSLKNNDAYAYAQTAYLEAKKRDPQNPINEFSLAELEYLNQTYSKALDHLNQALILKVNYIDARLLVSRIYYNQGKTSDSTSELDTIASMYPNSATVLQTLGVYALEFGFNQKSVEYLENSLRLDNTSVQTAGLLVRAYRKVGNTEGADRIIQSLKQAFSKNQSALDQINSLDSNTNSQSVVSDQVKTIPSKKK